MDTKKNNPEAEARKIIAEASETALSITGNRTAPYISTFVNIVLMELGKGRKRICGTDRDELIHDTINFMEQEKANVVYPSDRALLADYHSSIRNYVWSLINHREALYIIENLKRSQAFCISFFYSDRELKSMGDNSGINIKPIVSKIRYELISSYHVSIDMREISSIIYEYLWDNGRWSAFDGFRFESSFFHWLEKISRREVLNKLEKMGYIRTQKDKTPGNQRHILLSQTPEHCRLIIEKEIHGQKDRELLLYIYADRLDSHTIMNLMDMDEQTYKAACRKAEKRLIEGLLRSDRSYNDILRDKNPRDITVSLDAATEIISWMEAKVGDSSLREIFGVNLSDPEIEDCALNILTSVTKKMPWTERDRFIFSSRYFHNARPVELAETLGKTRAYIDTRFSRLQERFNSALRQWAVDMQLLTPRDVAAIERRIQERKARRSAKTARPKNDKKNENDNNNH